MKPAFCILPLLSSCNIDVGLALQASGAFRSGQPELNRLPGQTGVVFHPSTWRETVGLRLAFYFLRAAADSFFPKGYDKGKV